MSERLWERIKNVWRDEMIFTGAADAQAHYAVQEAARPVPENMDRSIAPQGHLHNHVQLDREIRPEERQAVHNAVRSGLEYVRAPRSRDEEMEIGGR